MAGPPPSPVDAPSAPADRWVAPDKPATLLQSGRDRVTVRLELLRLAHRADLTVEQIIERAKVLETWALGEPEADKP